MALPFVEAAEFLLYAYAVSAPLATYASVRLGSAIGEALTYSPEPVASPAA